MNKTLNFLLFFCCLWATASLQAQNLQKGEYGYLYCHMSGRGEWTAYALSRDGLNYHDLLNGDSIFSSTEKAAIEGGTRDAYICRKHDGSGYLMATTDMCVRKSKVWNNYGINLLTSDDLIHWESTTFDFRKGSALFSDPGSPDSYTNYSTINRVWAPQIIWDADYQWTDGRKGGYFVYYSLWNSAEEKYDRMYYSYADETFTTLTKPRLLFDWGYATIDADINYLESDGLFHLMIKKEGGKPGLFTATAPALTGPWSEPVEEDYVDFEGNKKCEGVSAFQLAGDSTWRVGYIEYSSNPKRYRICRADKYLRNFHSPQDIKGVDAPQHGSFMRLTKEEYERLEKHYNQIHKHGVYAQAPHPERIYLSGTGIDDTKTWEFFCTKGQNSGKWRKIEVPCNWELQGFGEYTYGRWYKVPGEKPSDEVGIYRHKFEAPKHWKDKRIKIYFDGVMTDVEVLINGQSAGAIHQGGFYRFSYDITELIEFGKRNTLEVKIAKESSNKSINAAERKADWWLFGGIYRPVWLEVVPKINMRHFILDARHDGTFSAAVEMEGDAQGYELSVAIRELNDGKEILTKDNQPLLTHRITNSDSEQQLKGVYKSIQPWNTENPQLYLASLTLKDPSGKAIQTRETRIGFRTVEFFPQDGIYLNGVKLVVKGINRHSFSVDGGRTTSAAMSRHDALLIKEMNMNAVRSHYPPDEHFLDMCDSLGIVYMDELAGWQNGYDSKVGPGLVKEMIERDVNHPCIIIWSNGNEGGWNYALDSLFAKYDKLQKRHVVHPWTDFNELDTHHYPAYLTGVARLTNGYKVFMPTEFMHAMYDQGGGAGLRDFWDRWLTNPMFAGGFIWVYCDEAPKRTDKGGILDSDKSNAPDGIVGPRREKEGSFYAIRAQWSPIQLKPLLITTHFNGSFLLTNEYTYTNLSQCRMIYKVLSCSTPLQDKGETTILAEGEVRLPAISPGETGTARFIVPEGFHNGDVLHLEAFDKEGKSICEWSYPIHLAKQYFEQKLSQTPMSLNLTEQATATQTTDEVILNSTSVCVTFDATTGLLRRVKAGDKEIPFKNGPRPIGMKMQYQPSSSYIRAAEDGAVFCAKYRGGADSIVWKLTGNGLLYMDAILLNRASGGGGFDDAFMDTQVYNLGLTFSYPEQACTGMRWMGRGPYRVWKNRIAGTTYGIWQKEYNNTITGESYENLVYPEFKGYHANMYWATLESDTAPFTVYSRNDGIFYHIFTPKEPAGRVKDTMPKFPEGDISFLLDIPAICSFKPIEQQGPNSQPGNIRIKSGDEGLHLNLMFDFR